MHNLTGIYWIKNETRYLPEWIEFHLIQGFDHFIFYDNGSTDDLEEVMKPYTDAGIVEIRKYPEPLYPPAKSGPPDSKNFWVMDYCIEEQRGKSRWIHFHAVDEFTFMVDGSNIVDFLKNYETIGALAVEWELMTSNGHIEMPKGLVIENYTVAYPDINHHVKTIIMPEKAVCTIGNPHNFFLAGGVVPVTENFDLLQGPFNTATPSFSKIRNHHYATRSKQEFDEKYNKGLLDFSSTENRVRDNHDAHWIEYNNHPEQYPCDELVKYAEPVREALVKRYAGLEHLVKKFLH
jgi:hypothetical protein